MLPDHHLITEPLILPPAYATQRSLWAIISVKKQFTLQDLQITVQASETAIRRYLKLLVNTGYLTEAKVTPRRYDLVRQTGPIAPIGVRGFLETKAWDPNRKRFYGRGGKAINFALSPDRREKLWACIRQPNIFNYQKLALKKFDEYEYRPYLDGLVAAGIVGLVGPGTFYLVQDLGPLSPWSQRKSKVYDPNSGQEFPL